MQKLIRFTLTLITGCTLLATAPAQAQAVSNGGFENWSMRNNTLTPDNWLTTDDVVAAIFGMPLPFSLNTVSRSTDRQAGSFAVKAETVANPLGADPVAAVLVLGNSISLRKPLAGMPIMGRPANFQFYYKLTGANVANDSAQVSVSLTRTVNNQMEFIAGAEQYLLTPRAGYTLLTLPLTYDSNAMPDSAHVFITSGDAETIHVGTALYLDDMRFTGTATANRNAAQDAALTVFPNPSTSGNFLLSSTEPALLAAPYTVLDATGRTVLRSEAARPTGTHTLDLGRQPAGIYTLQLQTAGGVITRKLVVQ